MTQNADTSRDERIYFPGPGIVVTSAWILTREGRYRVRDLHFDNLRYVYAYPARAVALYCGLVELLLAAGFAAAYGSAEVMLCAAGVVAAVGMTGAVIVDERRNPRWMELAAWHQGRHIVLYATDDRVTFGQVRRAVVRAVEANEPPLP